MARGDGNPGMMTPLLARAAMCRVAVLAACALLACELVATSATADDVRVDIGSRLTLARLLDLAAQQAEVSVDYAPADLERITVAVRLVQGATPLEVWELANQLLAQNGFTTVRVAGATTLSVVRLTDAAATARLEDAAPPDDTVRPGFEARLVELTHRPAKELVESLRLVASRPGGSVTAIGESRNLVLADLRPRLEQALWLAERLDTEGAMPPKN